ncbi:hypothetical protein DFH07DRAFT_946703 [Mycena maculata]|uniref:Fungal calcium binding protein domain-containing protein n=1 Tax=Mycena maculata TaxID=230809 RepID=A0AAD7HJY7_9AGAR|nr:hypothetical protein DFH07DRAFT_946703 [Mycena maculata]
MQFSLVALFAVLATGVAAAPTPLAFRQTCDIASCVVDLAPSVVSCASAAAQLGVDPVSDASCLIAAAKDVVELPASCNGCLAQFGVSDAASGVANCAESSGAITFKSVAKKLCRDQTPKVDDKNRLSFDAHLSSPLSSTNEMSLKE